MLEPHYWLMKTEPGAFSYDDLERDGWTHWDGVRNYQAKNNMAAMKVGDLALIYHSVTEKAVVGIGKITREAYPDPTDDTGKWIVVRVEPLQRLKLPVTLDAVKAVPELATIPLVRQGRLSVMALSEADFNRILALGKTKLSAAATP